MLCEGVVKEKVERYETKLRRQSGNRFRYTWEATIDGREVVNAHVDGDEAKAYRDRLPEHRILLPWSRMSKGERIRARLAKEQLEMRLDAKHGEVTLKVVA
jgi:hypothetical protein